MELLCVTLVVYKLDEAPDSKPEPAVACLDELLVSHKPSSWQSLAEDRESQYLHLRLLQ